MTGSCPTRLRKLCGVLATGVLFAYLVDFILRNVRGYFVDMAGRNADVVLSSKLINKVLGLRLDAKPDSTDGLVANLQAFEALREFFSSGSLVVVADMPFLIIFLWLISYIGGPLVFVPLAAIPLMIGVGLLLQLAARRSASRSYLLNVQKHALMTEIVHGLETVKTSGAEGRLLYLWEQLSDAAAETGRQSRGYATLTLSVTGGLSQLVSVGVIIWGVYLIIAGSLTMGGLIACNILAGRAMAPLMQLAGMISRLQQSRLALSALNTIMELPSEGDGDEEHADFGLLQPAFSFEHVEFSYPNAKKKALSDVSFSIRPHEKVGIIGRMGSGKSTVGRLMAGLYTPQSGAVRYGGVDARQLDPGQPARPHRLSAPGRDAFLRQHPRQYRARRSRHRGSDGAAGSLSGRGLGLHPRPARRSGRAGRGTRLSLSGGQQPSVLCPRPAAQSGSADPGRAHQQYG